MKKGTKRKGFTIVEVTLFLAISGALLAGLLAGSVSSIKRHRYNDSVNDFVEFLRRTYSEAINVQNERIGTIGDSRSCSITSMKQGGFTSLDLNTNTWKDWIKNTATGKYDGWPGRSQCAVYGVLITFGEDDATTIYTYDVIGRTLEDHQEFNANTTFSDIGSAMKFVNADILALRLEDKSNKPVCSIVAAGNTNRYNLQWDARAETVDGNLFKGSVLIVRSPISGTIHTLFLNKSINANSVIANTGNAYSVSDPNGRCANTSLTGYSKALNNGNLLESYINLDSTYAKTHTEERFKIETVDICVASNDSFDMGNQRRNVRILADGRNATAVELVAQDDDNPTTGNKCKG